MTKTKKNKKPILKYFSDTILITVSIVLVILIISFTIKITSGVAKSVTAPEHYVRLEIINASDEADLETKMEEYLKDSQFDNMQLEIVQSYRFDQKKSEESFLISRLKDKTAAAKLARYIQLDYENIPITPLPQNTKQITATLVLGNDSLFYKLSNIKKELE